jgi:hypothetical protein
MPNVIATHAVGNIDTWLAGGEERKALFSKFCRAYRVYRHPAQAKVSLVFESADMAKLEATLAEPATVALKAKHTVLDPIEVHLEVVDAR